MPTQRLLFLTELLKHPVISHSEVHRYLSKWINQVGAEAMHYYVKSCFSLMCFISSESYLQNTTCYFSMSAAIIS